jgi:hypothetical protein
MFEALQDDNIIIDNNERTTFFIKLVFLFVLIFRIEWYLKTKKGV